MQQASGPPSSRSGNLFALALDPVGMPLMTGCTLYLPFADVIAGPAAALDGAGSASTPFVVPAGFPGYLGVGQTVAIAHNPLGPPGAVAITTCRWSASARCCC